MADGAPSGKVSRRPHAVARAHLQPAAVRAIALGHEDQRRRLGHGGVSVGLSHRRASVRVPAALDPVAGVLVSPDAQRACCRGDRRSRVGGGAPARRRASSACCRRSRRTSPTRMRSRGGFAAAAASCGTGRRSRICISSSRSRGSAAGSAASFRRPKSRCRTPVAQTSRGPRPSLAEAWRAMLLLSGTVTEDRFWSETWTSAERVLSRLADWLRRSRAVRTIEIDEGWSDDRDVSVFVGRWAWLDARALVEEHGGGKSMLRVSTHLRPTMLRRRERARPRAGAVRRRRHRLALRWPPAGAITGGADDPR